MVTPLGGRRARGFWCLLVLRFCTNYFDATHLSCSLCLNGSVPKDDRLSCICPRTSRIIGSTASGPICQQCPLGSNAAPDGRSCIGCGGAANCSTSCPSNNVAVFRRIDGTVEQESPLQCVECSAGTRPNAALQRCEPCTGVKCLCSEGVDPTTCPSTVNSEATSSLETIFMTSGGDRVSRRLNASMVVAIARRCQLGATSECQALANLCVLQNYNRDVATACTLFEAISNRVAPNQWATGMQWLFYYNTEASAELTREGAIDQQYRFTRDANGFLDIVAARYALNGSFLGFVPLSGGSLRLCSESLAATRRMFVFGTRVRQHCKMELSELVADFPEPVFYDLYVRFTNAQGTKQLYPIPVLNEALRRNGQYPNREERSANWVLTRRFFLVDAWSLRNEAVPGLSTSNITALRHATSVELNIQTVETRDGHIYPPFIRITYAELPDGSVSPNSEIGVHFSITYSTDPFRHDKDLEISMAVLGSLTVLWAGLRAYSWGRRSGKQVADATTIIQFLLCECAILGDVFLFITAIASIWILAAYKAQSYVFYMQLTESQESTLMAYLIAAASLKLVGLLHRYASLMLTETFFIDWERPKVVPQSDLTRPTSLDPVKYDGAKEQSVVIWRTYLVANEWNELQNYRKTSIAIQLLAMFFFLEFLEWKHLAVWQPGFGTDLASEAFASSRVSRLAVSLFFYFVIGFTQWLLNVLIVERIILDPFHNFIDLCSIANISVLSLSHSLYGYYIHGRSVHGWADTGMSEMNEFLQRERDNLVGMRGLESGSELQTYCVSLPVAFRKKYDELAHSRDSDAAAMARLSTVDVTTAQMASRARTHAEINRFLQDMVEHALPDVDYTVRDRAFMEAALDIELSDSVQVGVFARDHSETGFSRCFVYGNEWVKLSFEAVLFSILYVYTSSLSLAAVTTYLSASALRLVADALFTNHLVKSSRVDHRFLI